MRAHTRCHPALVVEIAQSALRIARGRKAAAYARGGIDEYWILNLEDRVLEVRRAPAPMKRSGGTPPSSSSAPTRW
jgi:Uma2 family endonuclease